MIKLLVQSCISMPRVLQFLCHYMIKLLGENLIRDLSLFHCKANTLQVW